MDDEIWIASYGKNTEKYLISYIFKLKRIP